MAAHGYWYTGPEEPKELPPSLKKPWDEVNRRLGRKGTYLSGEDVQLYNFNYQAGMDAGVRGGQPFDCQTTEYAIENLDMLQTMWGNKAEVVFHLAFCEMAKAAAPLLGLMARAQDAVQREDDDEVLRVLQAVAVCVENIQVAFMRIVPDPSADLGIEPLVWAKTVAPVGVSFNKGMPSPSGLGTPFFHCLDMFFSRGKYSSTLGKDSLAARDFFPKNWTDVINAISHISVHVYVSSSDNAELHHAWSHAIDVYASWNGLLGKHLQKTYNFLELAFKTGREKTLGGFQGGFSDRMWDRVMDLLDKSRKERMTAKNATLKLPVATLSNIEGVGLIKTLVYDLPHEGFQYKPGDTVEVWPSNSPNAVDAVLNAIEATGDELVELSEEWRLHLKQFVDLGMKVGRQRTRAPLRCIVQYAQLIPVPEETRRFLTTLMPAYKVGGFASSNELDLPMLLGVIRMATSSGKNVFEVDSNGSMPNLRLDAEALFSQFVRNGVDPLVEDVVALLHSIGAREAPLFTERSVNIDIFTTKVFPVFQTTLKHILGERSIVSAVDIFRPIKPRQYSIANCRNHSRQLQLIVKRVSYLTPDSNDDDDDVINWKSHRRQTFLSQKYFKIWKRKALHKTGLSRVSSHHGFMDAITSIPFNLDKRHNGVASSHLCDEQSNLVFTIQSNPSFHAPRVDQPLVMIAASSGISPFMGFLQERVESGSSSETILFWSIPFVNEGAHILRGIENMIQCSTIKLDIYVCISQESICPIFRDGKFNLESRPKMRLTELLERHTVLRSKLHQMLLPKKYNADGGFVYLCGTSRFVESTLSVLSNLLLDMTLFKDAKAQLLMQQDSYGRCHDWLVKDMQSDKRILFEVFNDITEKRLPEVKISKLITMNDFRNNQNNGSWIAIYDKVYDISHFVHPGGERILESYAGMDSTVAWEAVRHHKSQSLNAKLETLLIGRLKRPKFPPLPLLQLDTETMTDLNGVFSACLRLTWTIVEIENATRMEYQLDKLHIAGDSDEKDLTPMKLQMLFQTHRRFVVQHITGIKKIYTEITRFQDALRRPQKISSDENFDDGFLKEHPSVNSSSGRRFSFIDDEIENSCQYHRVLVACDLFVKLCSCIVKRSGDIDEGLMGYLTNSVYFFKSSDLDLVKSFKMSAQMLIVYFETKESQQLSLTNLFYEISRLTGMMKLDLERYIEKCSSNTVVGQLFEQIDYVDFNSSQSERDIDLSGSKAHVGWQSRRIEE